MKCQLKERENKRDQRIRSVFPLPNFGGKDDASSFHNHKNIMYIMYIMYIIIISSSSSSITRGASYLWLDHYVVSFSSCFLSLSLSLC